MAKKLRQIIREPRFEQEAREAFSEVRRADEVMEGFEWVLARMAEYGHPVRGTPYRIWPLHPPGQSFAVYYRMRGDTLLLVSLRPIPRGPFR